MTEPRRVRKGDKRDRTRAALIRAAAALVGEKGFERTSLEEVAARAGMTRGAIYGNFRDREALFLAVAETYWAPVAPPITPHAPFTQQMRELAAAVVASLPERSRRAAGAASFQVFALTNKRLRTRLAKANAAIYRQAAARVRKTARSDELPIESLKLVKVLHALTDGLTFLHALTPDLVDEKIVIAAFDAIARAGLCRSNA
jgi:AcrR family transcriptional regulator